MRTECASGNGIGSCEHEEGGGHHGKIHGGDNRIHGRPKTKSVKNGELTRSGKAKAKEKGTFLGNASTVANGDTQLAIAQRRKGIIWKGARRRERIPRPLPQLRSVRSLSEVLLEGTREGKKRFQRQGER